MPPGSSDEEKKRRRLRLFGWWYTCIGIAFILLAFRSAVRGDALWAVIIRLVIGFGFLALSRGTLRRRT